MKKIFNISGYAALAAFLITLMFYNVVTLQDSGSEDSSLSIRPNEASAVEDTGGSGGWLWQAVYIDCTVTVTYTVEPFGVGGSWSESYAGTKRVCNDGGTLCLSWFCTRKKDGGTSGNQS